jgi:predicted phage terminase large subunit-like protein
MVDAPPRCIRRLRAWDFAATPADIRGDGDYTVGALLGTVSGGGWVILDLVRARIAGGSIVALVKRTAEQDGREVAVAVEQEPGSAGKVATAYLIRELAGWNVRAIVPSTNKLTRAMPLFAQAEAGNISLVRAGWNQAWLDEVASFPGGDHDDQVDAVAHSFNALTADSGGIKSGWVA